MNNGTSKRPKTGGFPSTNYEFIDSDAKQISTADVGLQPTNDLYQD